MTDTKKLIVAAVVVVILIIGMFIGSKSGKWVTFPTAIKNAQSPEVSPTPTPAAKNQITIENFAYSPANLVIKAGDSVTWVNKDSIAHTATADDRFFDTDLLSQNESATVTFDTPGTFSYHCTPHPQMLGTIVVE